MKNNVYYIIAIFMLFSIVLSPVLAEESNKGDKTQEDSLNSYKNPLNDKVVVKAGTTQNNNNNNNKNNEKDEKNSNLEDNSNKNTNQKNDDIKIKPKKLTQSQILKASVNVNKHVSKYKKLPNKVRIEGYDFSISEYSYLVSKTIHYKYKKNTNSITVKYNIKNPSSPSGSKISGRLSSKYYYKYATKFFKFIEKKNIAPNYVNTKIGKMQYQTAVYSLNKILYLSNKKGQLPSSLKLKINKNHKINKALPIYERKKFSMYPNDIESLLEFIIIKTKYGCGPIKIKYNGKYLISTGKCSCGKAGNYKYHTRSFINYCPYCKVGGHMKYEEGPTCPEGMWVCSKCDADFCLVTGKEHITRSPKYLKS